MKKIKFLRDVPDKYTKEMYVKNQEKIFENKRADEILNARDQEGKPYAEEVLQNRRKETEVDKREADDI